MTTTAHEDQFTADPEHVTHRPYDTAAILRQNVADLERELQRQRERAEAATARLRDQIERVTSEWERAESAMASAREDLQSFIDSRDAWMARAHAAEAELKAARASSPAIPAPVPTPETNRDRAARITASWPEWKRNYRLTKHSPIPAPAPAVPVSVLTIFERLRDDLLAAHADAHDSMHRALLQSGGGK